MLVMCVLDGFAKSPRRSWRRNPLLTLAPRQEGAWPTRSSLWAGGSGMVELGRDAGGWLCLERDPRWAENHRITACFGLEGTFRGHLAQPPSPWLAGTRGCSCLARAGAAEPGRGNLCAGSLCVTGLALRRGRSRVWRSRFWNLFVQFSLSSPL